MRLLSIVQFTLLIIISSTVFAEPVVADEGFGHQVTSPNSMLEPDSYPSFKGVALSILPGILVHGSGHYFTGNKDTGLDLLILEGVSLGVGVSSLVAFAYLGAAAPFCPVLIPLMIFGAVTFVSSWLFDILGTAGVSGSLKEGFPYIRSLFELSFGYQQDYQSPYNSFLEGRYQFAKGRNYFDLTYVHEAESRYQNIQLIYGYNLLAKELWNLHLIPRIRYEQSHEQFSITKADLSVRVDLNLGRFWKTLNNIYFVNSLGYGYQWFHFNGKGFNPFKDFSLSTMRITQGLRMHFDNFELGSLFMRKTDDMVAGNDYILASFKHHIEAYYKTFYGRLTFTHGRGYSIFSTLGVRL